MSNDRAGDVGVQESSFTASTHHWRKSKIFHMQEGIKIRGWS